MNQQTLFGDTTEAKGSYGEPIARRIDPETSHEAAAKVDVSTNELLFLKTINRFRHLDMTAKEVAAQSREYTSEEKVTVTDSKRETVRKRASGLEKKWLISRTGSRPCKITGNRSSVYQITKLGIQKVKEAHHG